MGETTVKGLKIYDGTPVGAAGLALNDNFTALANRSGPLHEHASDPGVNDDASNTGGNGVVYKNTLWRNTASGALFLCTSDTTGAATWLAIGNRRDITFGLLGDLLVGNDQTNHIQLMYSGVLLSLRAIARTAPVGSAAIFNINKNGVLLTSITIAAGATSAVVVPTGTFVAGDYLSIDVTQIGSEISGADVSITLTIHYFN